MRAAGWPRHHHPARLTSQAHRESVYPIAPSVAAEALRQGLMPPIPLRPLGRRHITDITRLRPSSSKRLCAPWAADDRDPLPGRVVAEDQRAASSLASVRTALGPLAPRSAGGARDDPRSQWPVHDRGSTAPSGVVARPSASQGPDGRSAPFRQGLGATRTRPKSEWYAHLTLPPRLMATAEGRRAFREDPRAPSRLPTPGRGSRLYYQRYLAEATMVL